MRAREGGREREDGRRQGGRVRARNGRREGEGVGLSLRRVQRARRTGCHLHRPPLRYGKFKPIFPLLSPILSLYYLERY